MKIVFMGTPDFSLPSLERILKAGHEILGVYSRPDRPRGRGLRVHPPPVKKFAETAGLRVFQPRSLKDQTVFERFRSLDCELLVVVAFGRILPESWLHAPPLGAVNLHASLLPRHRGAAPVAWSILRGDRETGVTTMRMDAGMDTGDILLQKSMEIGTQETAGELSDRMAVVGADLLAETLDRLRDGTLTGTAQDSALATLSPRIRPEDARIDWTAAAAEISRRIRAFHPRPGAFTRLRGRRLKISRGIQGPRSLPRSEAMAGEVLEIGPQGMWVACGDETFLRIEEIQPEGGERMRPEAFARGRQLHAGDRFANE